MQFHKIIEQRKSIREFKDKNIENEVIYNLQEYTYKAKHLQNDIATSFHFLEDGHKVHEYLLGKAGYYGMAIDAPHYLVLISEKKEHYKKNAGYMMEQILLKAFEMKIGSCWIDVVDEVHGHELKTKLKIDKQGEIVALAALGYPKTNIFGIETSVSGRQSIEELVYDKIWGKLMDLGELNQRGLEEIFYYARHAPSWGNIQPWKFIIDDDKLILTMLQQDSSEKLIKDHEIDSGIMMLYIEKMMHKQGIQGKWDFNINELDVEKYNMPDNCVIKGWFPI
jgi:nitroreductase